MSELLDTLNPERRAAAQSALREAFGKTAVEIVQPVLGGASSASAFRVEAGGRSYLLRIEGPVAKGMHNPHQYACMQTAAEARIAPALRYVNAAGRVAVMDFVAARPTAEFPGGPLALARALGELIGRLQATPAFPTLASYPELLAMMFGRVRDGGGFAPGLLDPHAEAFARLREACPWDEARLVSSHNDPNPRNILFDGERLWLIDWETAYRNDPLVDVAILTHESCQPPEMQAELLRTWLGREPDGQTLARFTLVGLMTRLYYASLMLNLAPPPEPETDLAAPDPERFRAAVFSGELPMGSPAMLRTLAKIMLAGFLEACAAPKTQGALAVARNG